MRIVLAGFGNMGRALSEGWRKAASSGTEIIVVDPSIDARNLAAERGFGAFGSAADVTGAIDIAVLAVKPAAIEAVLQTLPPAGLYLSIAAGRTISDLAGQVPSGAAIVRAMPNTPAAIGLGISGLCANEHATEADRDAAAALLAVVGQVEWVQNEADMDAVTAVSGSGPAYVFLLVECLTAAGIEIGLEPSLAARLATATVHGAGAYAARSGRDAATLRREVTSPGGTTAAALSVLSDEDALEALIRKAVRAAWERSRELGGGR